MCNLGFSSQKEKSKQTQQSKTDPYKVAVPGIKEFMGELRPEIKGVFNPTAGQTSAYEALKSNYSEGNPYASKIDDIAGQLFDAKDYAPQVGRASEDYMRRLNPVADGQNLDLGQNKYLQDMLTKVGGDAQKRVASTYAASGRAFSPDESRAIGEGVTNAQLPLLLQQFNLEQGRTDSATRDLMTGASSSASTQQNLDTARAALQRSGIDVGTAAMNAENWGPEQLMALEQQMRLLPYEEAQAINQMLLGIGGAGSQSSGTATGTSKSSGFSAGAKLDGASILKAIFGGG